MRSFLLEKIPHREIKLFFFIILPFIACNEAVTDKRNNLEQSSSYPDTTTHLQIMDHRLEEFKEEGGIFSNIGNLSLDIGNDYIGQYQVYHLSENGTLTGYNRHRHSLEFIDLKQQKIYNSIQFASEGPKSIRNVTGIYYQNRDSIFVTSDFHLLMINEQGDVEFDYKINQPMIEHNDLNGFDFSSFVLIPGKAEPIHFYSSQQALIMPMHSIKYDQWTIPQFYESPVCAKILLKTKEVKMIPLHYPDEYRKNSYALINQTFFAYNKDRIIVGFNNSPRLFSYSLEDETVSVHNCKSRYYRKLPPYTQSSGDEFAMTAYLDDMTMFMSLNYIPNKHRYYLASATKEKDFPGFIFNLTVLNEDLETMCELTLPDPYPPIFMLSVSNGLAFRYRKESTSMQSVYQVVDIDCK